MKRLFYLFSILLFVACSSEQDNTNDENPHQKFHVNPQQRILELEALVYSDTATILNVPVAVELAGLYTHLVKEYPANKDGADLLFKAGELYMNAKQGNKAIAQFKEVHTRFPASDKAPIARFLKGFVAETILNDDQLAKRSYQEFISAHPDHKLAEDAKASIELVGLTDEELLIRLKNKNES